MKVSGNGANGAESGSGKRAEPVLNLAPINNQQPPQPVNGSHEFADVPTLAQASAKSRASSTTIVLAAEKAKQGAQSHQKTRCCVALYVKYKPGVADAARQIISEHFWPVDHELHRDMLAFDFYTGEWDRVVYFPNDIPEQVAWIPSPMMAGWIERFYEREGGKQNGQTIWNRYNDMVERCKTEIAVLTVPA